MIFNNNTAQKTAELLLQINAIKLNTKNYFTWASGWKSPIYCDNRIILSFPAVRNYIRDEFAKHIEEKFGKPDVIAGVATGAAGVPATDRGLQCVDAQVRAARFQGVRGQVDRA